VLGLCHEECETCPHEWMLGGAAMKIQTARDKLASYIRAHKQDVALIENCTAATTAVVRAAGIRAAGAYTRSDSSST